MGKTVVKRAETETNPEVVNDNEFPLGDEKQAWLFEAMEEVHYRWSLYMNAKTPGSTACTLTDLSNTMHDLFTYHPGYCYETGTMPWERKEEV